MRVIDPTRSYFSAKPCALGHFERYRRNDQCAVCMRAYSKQVKRVKKLAKPPEYLTGLDLRGAQLRAVELLTGQLNAQKARWGFI